MAKLTKYNLEALAQRVVEGTVGSLTIGEHTLIELGAVKSRVARLRRSAGK